MLHKRQTTMICFITIKLWSLSDSRLALLPSSFASFLFPSQLKWQYLHLKHVYYVTGEKENSVFLTALTTSSSWAMLWNQPTRATRIEVWFYIIWWISRSWCKTCTIGLLTGTIFTNPIIKTKAKCINVVWIFTQVRNNTKDSAKIIVFFFISEWNRAV